MLVCSRYGKLMQTGLGSLHHGSAERGMSPWLQEMRPAPLRGSRGLSPLTGETAPRRPLSPPARALL